MRVCAHTYLYARVSVGPHTYRQRTHGPASPDPDQTDTGPTQKYFTYTYRAQHSPSAARGSAAQGFGRVGNQKNELERRQGSPSSWQGEV